MAVESQSNANCNHCIGSWKSVDPLQSSRLSVLLLRDCHNEDYPMCDVPQLTVVVSTMSTVVLWTGVGWRHWVGLQPAAGSKLSVTATRYVCSDVCLCPSFAVAVCVPSVTELHSLPAARFRLMKRCKVVGLPTMMIYRRAAGCMCVRRIPSETFANR